MTFLNRKRQGYTVDVACRVLECTRQWLYSTRSKALKDGHPCPFGSVEERGVLILDAGRIDALASAKYCQRFVHKRNQNYHINAVIDGEIAHLVEPGYTRRIPSGVDLSEATTAQGALLLAAKADSERAKEEIGRIDSAIDVLQKRLGDFDLPSMTREQLIRKGQELAKERKRLEHRLWSHDEDVANLEEVVQAQRGDPSLPQYMRDDPYVKALVAKHDDGATPQDNRLMREWWDEDAPTCTPAEAKPSDTPSVPTPTKAQTKRRRQAKFPKATVFGLLPAKECAAGLGMSYGGFMQAVKAGRLPKPVKTGHTYMWAKRDFKHFTQGGTQ